jgi:hypothetical protein
MVSIYSPLRFLSQSNEINKKSRYVMLALLALSNTAILNSAKAMDENALEAVSKMTVKPQRTAPPIALANIVESPTALSHIHIHENIEVDTLERSTHADTIPDDIRNLEPIELLRKGYSRDAVLAANYPAEELFATGFSADELIGAGYTDQEILDAQHALGLHIASEDVHVQNVSAPARNARRYPGTRLRIWNLEENDYHHTEAQLDADLDDLLEESVSQDMLTDFENALLRTSIIDGPVWNTEDELYQNLQYARFRREAALTSLQSGDIPEALYLDHLRSQFPLQAARPSLGTPPGGIEDENFINTLHARFLYQADQFSPEITDELRRFYHDLVRARFVLQADQLSNKNDCEELAQFYFDRTRFLAEVNDSELEDDLDEDFEQMRERLIQTVQERIFDVLQRGLEKADREKDSYCNAPAA